jgi:hypothetical protein
MNNALMELTDEQNRKGIRDALAGEGPPDLAAMFFLWITGVFENVDFKTEVTRRIEVIRFFWDSDHDCQRRALLADSIVETAEQDGLAWQAVLQFTVELLRSEEFLPESIRMFAASCLDMTVKRPRSGVGAKYTHRNYSFCLAVGAVASKFSMSPTRNEISPSHSACDLVAHAASILLKEKITYDVVRKAWEKNKKGLDKFGSTPLEGFAIVLEVYAEWRDCESQKGPFS